MVAFRLKEMGIGETGIPLTFIGLIHKKPKARIDIRSLPKKLIFGIALDS